MSARASAHSGGLQHLPIGGNRSCILQGALRIIWICDFANDHGKLCLFRPRQEESNGGGSSSREDRESSHGRRFLGRASSEGKKPTTMVGGSSARAAAKEGKKNTTKKKALMSQSEIDSHIRYQTVEFLEDDMVKVGDDMDEYFAKIIRDINRIESRHVKGRNNVLKQYYEKGYVEKDAYNKGYFAQDVKHEEKKETVTSSADKKPYLLQVVKMEKKPCLPATKNPLLQTTNNSVLLILVEESFNRVFPSTEEKLISS